MRMEGAAAEDDTNDKWLSFQVMSSPMELMLPTHHHQHPQSTSEFLLDSFTPAPDLGNHQKVMTSCHLQGMGMYTVNAYGVDHQHLHHNSSSSSSTSTMPKLEDFFGRLTNQNPASFNNDSTTQDSSSQLTHLYDSSNNHQHPYFSDHHQHQSLSSFSNNSGSEVDDSASVLCPTTQLSSSPSVGFNSTTTEKTSVAATNNKVKVADTFGQRTSIYRGVTRWTGRYEAHLWDNSCRREGQARKGRQVYLGGYDKEERAARAYDLAALKYWGPSATTNFPISDYTSELEDMEHSTKQEFIASIRRKSSGFSRGASIYRGVTRHHQQGRWQARIGRVAGNKDLYLGTFANEEEAAEAYDIAAIKFRGVNAVTNFEMKRYDVEAILNSNLPVGGAAKRLKLATESSDQKPTLSIDQHSHSSYGSNGNTGNTINFSAIQPISQVPCAIPFDAATTFYHQNLLHHMSSNGAVYGLTQDMFVGPTNLMPQTPAEFYIWPPQSY